MDVWFNTIASVIVVSLISLIGIATLAIRSEKLGQFIFVAVALSTGAMYGDAFIHLIPESFERLTNNRMIGVGVMIGISVFFILEKFLRWHHAHSTELPEVTVSVKPVGYLNLFSDGVHNFFDGLLIGASYLVSPQVGLATTIAVVLYEIPQEIGDFGVLIHAGFSKKRALLFNFLTALTALAGAIMALVLCGVVETFSVFMLPVTAGGFIYIAGSDLVPELQKEISVPRSAVQFVTVVAGVILMLLLP